MTYGLVMKPWSLSLRRSFLLLLPPSPSPPPPPPSTFYKSLQTAAAVEPIVEHLIRTPNPFADSSSVSSSASPPPSESQLLSDVLAIISCAKTLSGAAQIHAHLVKSGLAAAPSLRHHLVSLYSRCRSPDSARKFFDEIFQPDHVSWSALISAYSNNGLGRHALDSFRAMRSCGVRCNEFTLPSVVKACSLVQDFGVGAQVHSFAIITGFESDVFVANTLVVFYANFGRLEDSKKLFDGIANRNIVSWNALLAGYVRNDRCEDATRLFQKMVLEGTKPNEFSFSCVLNACTGVQDLFSGRAVHGYLTRLEYDGDLFTANALVDMYAKLGNVNVAALIFERMTHRDVISWNSLIAGCALHGYHSGADSCLQR